MRVIFFALVVFFSLSSISCTQPETVAAETELFSPGGEDEEVIEKPGG